MLTTALPFTVSAAVATQDSVCASSGTTGDCTWTLDDDGTLTISGNGAMMNYDDYPWNAFVSRVVIENGVTSIGNRAFMYCEDLTSVTIPDSITYIDNNVFSDCTGLTSITIPKSVTSLGNYTFDNCPNVTILCIKNSYAHKYAVEKNISFIATVSESIGDANGNGTVNVTDVTRIQRHVSELQQIPEDRLLDADTNGDGVVDINDATFLQMYLAEYDLTLG